MSTPSNRIKGFQPHCFIQAGSTNAMYTLRQTCLKYIPGPGPYGNAVVDGVYQGTVELSSEYLCNLSIDFEEAARKAEARCKEMGIPLRLGKGHDLRDIVRAKPRTSEEVAEAERQATIESTYRQAHWADSELMNRLTREPAGRMHFGKYGPADKGTWEMVDGEMTLVPPQGQTWAEIAEYDRPYLEWFASQADETKYPASALRAAQLRTWLDNHPDQTPQPLDEHYGEIGQRITAPVQVTFVRTLFPEFGPSKILVKMMTEDRHLLTTFYSGGKWEPEAGQKVTLRFTVKRHGEYQGQKETIVNRAAVEA